MKFSVLLPTRNRLDLLKYAVDSVLQQNYENWEIIISDNASDEDVGGYVRSLNDSRIKYSRSETFLPVTKNWNRSLDLSSGDFVIMLGDDDCLLKNYFTDCVSLIKEHSSPDLVYTSALIYSYPNVLPHAPEGSLAQMGFATFLVGKREPYVVKKEEALRCVKQILNFNVAVNFNMQHSLVSRSLICRMKEYGEFYQSPYPDYYATTALLLKAERILAVPSPKVVIGISPKSFGFYYFNNNEKDGVVKMKNEYETTIYSKIGKYFLPGSNMNDSWLLSMESVKSNFVKEFPLKVNYRKYRFLQVLQQIKAYACSNEIPTLRMFTYMKRLSFLEKLTYLPLLFITMGLKLILNKSLKEKIFTKLTMRFSHPNLCAPIHFKGNYQNILEVFNRVNLGEGNITL